MFHSSHHHFKQARKPSAKSTLSHCPRKPTTNSTRHEARREEEEREVCRVATSSIHFLVGKKAGWEGEDARVEAKKQDERHRCSRKANESVTSTRDGVFRGPPFALVEVSLPVLVCVRVCRGVCESGVVCATRQEMKERGMG